jgi:hypothetical protein
MTRIVIRRIHFTAAVAAVAIVASFLVATLLAEGLGDERTIATVKAAIVRVVPALVVVMATAGLTGRRLGGRSRAPVVVRKARRMRAIGATGLLVLVPCAIVLDRLAAGGNLGGTFVAVQSVELVAGGVNLTLLVRNARDGLRMRRGKRARRRGSGSGRVARLSGQPSGPAARAGAAS